MTLPRRNIDREWRETRTTGFMQRAGGLLARRCKEGNWIYGLKTGKEHANPLGLVHGGVLTTLADHAMSLVAWEAAGRVPVVTVQLSATFLQAARTGDLLEARSEIESMRSDMLFVSCSIETPRGRIMLLNGIWKAINKRVGGN